MKRAVWGFLLAATAADPALAQSDACATVDPENYDQVYACLSSLQRADGRTMVQGNLDTAPCRTVIARYRGAGPGRGAQRLQGCGDVFGAYETGLRR